MHNMFCKRWIWNLASETHFVENDTKKTDYTCDTNTSNKHRKMQFAKATFTLSEGHPTRGHLPSKAAKMTSDIHQHAALILSRIFSAFLFLFFENEMFYLGFSLNF